MKKDDLTNVRYIGAVRMKLLYDAGITTFKQLFETPLGKLAQVKNIGKHYAKQIKDAVAEVYVPPVEKAPEKRKDKTKKKVAKPNKKLQKKVNLLNTNLKKAIKKLKSLGKKNEKIVADFKKKSKKLKLHTSKLDGLDKKLPKRAAKKLDKKADALMVVIKKMGKKPQKKACKLLSEELQAFNKSIGRLYPEIQQGAIDGY